MSPRPRAVSAVLVARDVHFAAISTTRQTTRHSPWLNHAVRRRDGARSRRSAQHAQRELASVERARARSSATAAGRDDAIALLKADHREVERLFGEFEQHASDDRKRELAEQICLALRAHTTIEEEIFYPAFLEATEDTEMHHEAEIEHAGAKHLIDEIESAGPEDDHFEARVTVLAGDDHVIT